MSWTGVAGLVVGANAGPLRGGVTTFTLGIALLVTALGILFKQPIHALVLLFVAWKRVLR